MASRPNFSEAAIMEQYRVALENAQTQPEIAVIMAELGYTADKIAEGKALLAQTRSAYDLNKTETDETKASSAAFSNARKQLEDIFVQHRKKAQVVFRNDPVTASRLSITGERPKTSIKMLEAARKFYAEATSDTDIQSKLARLAITPEALTAANALVANVEKARAEYLREVGESQDATKTKDSAFAAIDDWMGEFYAVAKIGLQDKPQLLEVLGKVVKS